MNDELLTKEDLAARLRLSPATVQLWASEGKIPCVRISANRMRFVWGEVLERLKAESERSEGRTRGSLPAIAPTGGAPLRARRAKGGPSDAP